MEGSEIQVISADNKMLVLYDQAEVEYNANGGTLNPRSQACSTCRWFRKGVDGGYDCHIVDSYPAEIVSNGWCNQWTAVPQPKPFEVVVVEVETEPVIEVGTMEAKPPSIIERITDAVKTVLGRDSPDDIGFKVYGNHWIATYSGTFEDREGEFFTKQGCDDYVARAELGLIDYPVLALWHVVNPETMQGAVIGKAKALARIGNFMVAAGEFNDDPASQKAKAYYSNSRNARKTALSHGFLYDSKHKQDDTYHRWNTFEITLLPEGAEAFPYTAFEVKERGTVMPISDQARKYLSTVLGEDDAAKAIALREQQSKVLEAKGIRYKDFTPATQTDAKTDDKAVTDEGFKAFVGTILQDHGTLVELFSAMDSKIDAMQKQLDERATQIATLQKALAEPITPASKSDATVVTDADAAAKAAAELQQKSQTVNPFNSIFPDLVQPASS